jgi:hypothetical protein
VQVRELPGLMGEAGGGVVSVLSARIAGGGLVTIGDGGASVDSLPPASRRALEAASVVAMDECLEVIGELEDNPDDRDTSLVWYLPPLPDDLRRRLLPQPSSHLRW